MDRNQALFDRAKAVIPGGVNSPVRAFKAVGGTPRFVQRAQGAYFWDANGQQYIDYIGSWGPMILGHGHPAVIEAVQKATLEGFSYGAPTEREVELAEEILKLMPSMEMVRLVSSGTDLKAATTATPTRCWSKQAQAWLLLATPAAAACRLRPCSTRWY
jgi:glutamate-1-semialdehyde 2,1-aminomutase